MINVKDYDIFVNNICTLKEASLDKHDKNEYYLTESLIDVINFDKVKESYIKGLALTKIPKSNDALMITEEKIIFIEFKAGYLNDSKCFSLRKKIYDSTLIFSDITSMQISEMRSKVDYILVYVNSDKNRNIILEEQKEKRKNRKTHVDSSQEFDELADMLISIEGTGEYISFGVDMFKNYCYKTVHTYTQEKFEEFLESLNLNQPIMQ